MIASVGVSLKVLYDCKSRVVGSDRSIVDEILTSEDKPRDLLSGELATVRQRSRRLLRLQALDCMGLDSGLRDQLQRQGQTLYAAAVWLASREPE